MSATVYAPGGSSDRGRGFKQYANEHFGKNETSQIDKNGFPATAASPNATPPPLKNLLTVVLDPAWYAVNSLEWGSPLRDRLPVTYLDLADGITEVADVAYAESQVIGRAEMYKTYTGTMNREVSLRFQFRAQGISGVDYEDSIRREVINPAKWLDALKYPVVKGELSIPPPPVILVLGNLLVMRAVATAVSLQWGGIFDNETMLPLSADVEVTFTAVHSSLGAYEFDRSARFATFQPPSGLLAGE